MLYYGCMTKYLSSILPRSSEHDLIQSKTTEALENSEKLFIVKRTRNLTPTQSEDPQLNVQPIYDKHRTFSDDLGDLYSLKVSLHSLLQTPTTTFLLCFWCCLLAGFVAVVCLPLAKFHTDIDGKSKFTIMNTKKTVQMFWSSKA